METNKLLHFITVHETQNLRQAAELLNMSHGALSKSLKTLELELGYKLFLPKGRGIISTKKAESTYLKAKSILQDVTSLSQADSSEEKQLIRIATFEVFSTYFLCLLQKGWLIIN